MPKLTQLAFRIYFAALALTPIVAFLDPTPWPALPEGAGVILVQVILLFFVPLFAMFALVLYKAYRGRNWARIVLLLIHVLTAVPYAKQLSLQVVAAPMIGVLNVLLALAQVVAVVLLFTRSSNAWFKSAPTATVIA